MRAACPSAQGLSGAAGLQHQESYLRGFIGIGDVEVVSAEGVNISPDHKQTALDAAVAQAGALAEVRKAA